MTSAVGICNLALGHLGEPAIISSIEPPDGSARASLCAQFYPIARDALLAMHAWNCNTRREALALLSTSELPAQWAYCYAKPNDCLGIISVLPPLTADSRYLSDPWNPQFSLPSRPGDLDVQPFVAEILSDGSEVIFTNVESATARMKMRVVDTSKYSPLMATALSRLLASYLAGPVVKGVEGVKVAQAHFTAFINVELPTATAADAKGQQVNAYRNFMPDSLAARN